MERMTVVPTCDFAILKMLHVREVEQIYVNLVTAGFHKRAPAAGAVLWLRDLGPHWVLCQIPLDALNYQTEDESSDARQARAKEYAARSSYFPPGIASYAGRSRARRGGKAYVADGNHRVLAAHYRGECAVRMMMEISQYRALIRDVHYRMDPDARR
jgi:hypothetical protein